jgi:glycosyltransferase involved in cell wall biosynthesis
MKVLWFSPTASLAENHLNNKPMNGGFIKSLDKEIQKKVELYVAFYHHRKVPEFCLGETVYYPIERGQRASISYLKKKFFNEIEPKSDLIKFQKIIDEIQPDLIHIHGTERPFGLIQRFCKIPTVVSIQGNISVYKYKFFSGISMMNILRFTRLKNWLAFNTHINKYFFLKKQSRREKQIFKSTKNFIGRTYWDKRIVKVLSPNSNYFLNNEILKDEFYDNEWSNSFNDKLSISTTTAPDLCKGIETLLYCAHLLDLNKINFTWRVAGVCRSDDIVRIACKSLGINASANVQFLGRLDDNQLVKTMLRSSIYVAISHIENSPNSLCEALMLGMPCIATNAGGTSNFIEDRNNGILIQDGDPYAMAGAIMELKENFDEAVNYGKNARKIALIKHNKEKIVNDLLDIYKCVANGA